MDLDNVKQILDFAQQFAPVTAGFVAGIGWGTLFKSYKDKRAVVKAERAKLRAEQPGPPEACSKPKYEREANGRFSGIQVSDSR